MIPPYKPEALFGDLLWGNSLVRFIFVDEAGTSEHEPVTVVVGLIVHADKQLLFAEAAVDEALGAIPSAHRGPEPEFHATEIWSSPRYREGWTMAGRLALLKTMMSLPKRLEIPITLSIVRRDTDVGPIPERLTKQQFQHVIAFAHCMTCADGYLRRYSEPNEVGAVVAEDVPEIQKFLAIAPAIYRDNPRTISQDHIRPTSREKELGYLQSSGELRVARIRKRVHFVPKGDPLLMLADACAFGFRRFFAGEVHGDSFCDAILGGLLSKDDWSGPVSSRTFHGHPATSYHG